MTTKPARLQPLGAGGGPPLLGQAYRAGMHAELQKFGRAPAELSRLVAAGHDFTSAHAEETVGLDLSVAEDKALSAIQILLDRRHYRGNAPDAGEEESESFRWRGVRPRLVVTWAEFFEAYGLKPDRHGQYRGKGAQGARKALTGLTKLRRIAYSRPRFDGNGKARKKTHDVIVTCKALVEITKAYKGLTTREAQQIMAGAELTSRATRLLIEVSPLLLDQIDTFHLLKPIGLHAEIENLLGTRYSPAIPRFISYLLTKNQVAVKVKVDVLLRRLRLEPPKTSTRRPPARTLKILAICFEVAFDLGYLSKPVETMGNIYVFHLNPHRCSRTAKSVHASAIEPGTAKGGSGPAPAVTTARVRPGCTSSRGHHRS